MRMENGKGHCDNENTTGENIVYSESTNTSDSRNAVVKLLEDIVIKTNNLFTVAAKQIDRFYGTHYFGIATALFLWRQSIQNNVLYVIGILLTRHYAEKMEWREYVLTGRDFLLDTISFIQCDEDSTILKRYLSKRGNSEEDMCYDNQNQLYYGLDSTSHSKELCSTTSPSRRIQQQDDDYSDHDGDEWGHFTDFHDNVDHSYAMEHTSSIVDPFSSLQKTIGRIRGDRISMCKLDSLAEEDLLASEFDGDEIW